MASELRPECEEGLVPLTNGRVIIGDFLTLPKSALLPFMGPSEKADVLITNPPFRLAYEFIERSFSLARIVVMLLRVNFLESEKRCDFMQQYPPDLYVLPNRPAFSRNKKGKKGTDSIAYGWMIWPEERNRRSGRLTVLGNTPKYERLFTGIPKLTI